MRLCVCRWMMFLFFWCVLTGVRVLFSAYVFVCVAHTSNSTMKHFERNPSHIRAHNAAQAETNYRLRSQFYVISLIQLLFEFFFSLPCLLPWVVYLYMTYIISGSDLCLPGCFSHSYTQGYVNTYVQRHSNKICPVI